MKHLILALFILVSTKLSAYTNTEVLVSKIQGKIIDSKENVPIAYATVAIYKLDSTLIDGGMTNESGIFVFDVEPGEFYVEVQFLAFKKHVVNNVTVSDRRSRIDLGTIALERSSINLNEVVIQGERSEMVIGVDRKIFNVGKDLGNTGNSAAEILDNIPSVAVDAEGNVTLRGSGGVRILIDGKPSGLVNSGNAESLRALQGNMVERVELITNPSARYEAEGMVGIINIVLKKDQRTGVNGSFEVSAGIPESYSASANVNFRREVINYFFSYGVRYNEREGDGKSTQIFPLADEPFKRMIENNRLRTGWSQNLRGGADFFINKKTTLTAAALVSFDHDESDTKINYSQSEIELWNPYSKSLRIDAETEVERNMEFSVNLEKLFDAENHKINFFAQYMEDGETEDSELEESILLGTGIGDPSLFQSISTEEREKNILIEGDYVYPFGDDGRFEAGLRSELRKIRNPYEVQELESGNWINLPTYTNSFFYDENVVAGYLQGANKFGKISLQIGLRIEYSDIKTFLEQGGIENNRSYFDFFPTLHTTYHFNTFNAWQISYSRRINRPNFRNLNPFSGLSDSRNIRTGNPDLNPEYTDAYESGYVYTPGKTSIYAGVYYRHTNGVVEQISYADGSGITYSLPLNLAQSSAYGAETNISVDAFKWWTLSGNLNLYRMQTEGVFTNNNITTNLASDTRSWDTRLNSRMKFPKSLNFQTTFFYRGQQETTQGLRKPFYVLNTSVSKDVLKGNGTLTLNVQDVLNSRNFRYENNQPDLISQNEFRWSGRQLQIGRAHV